jgi:hypothetical protein
MLRRFLSLLAGTTVALVATSASAQTILFASMTNGNEVPPAVPTLQNGQPRPASFGEALFILSADGSQMTMDATINNIDVTGSQSTDPNDNLTNAHIHAGAAPAPTFGVVWGFHGSPFNNNNPNEGVVTPFATGVGGRFQATWNAPEGQNTTLTAQIPNILAGRSYINFHTVQFGGGEIRGTLNVVPEPSAVALLGAAGLLALRRRRRA